jgi:ABC-type sugar transport system substrate-binding protein
LRLESLVAVVSALNGAGSRFLVAGGVAVNLHGYIRATQDLDLVVGLSPENALSAIQALAALDYRPQVPVAMEDFADPAKRRDWVETKGMEVFSLVSDAHPETTVDLFVTEPFSFEEEYRLAHRFEIAPGVEVATLRPQALIAMKRAVGRARDLDDIQHLEWLREEGGLNG